MYESSFREALEDGSTSLESEAASSRTSTSDSEGPHDSRATNHWRGFFRMLKKGSQVRFHTFPPLKNVPKLSSRKSKRNIEDTNPALDAPVLDPSIDGEFCRFKSSWKNFTLTDLQAATNNFSDGKWFLPRGIVYSTGLQITF